MIYGGGDRIGSCFDAVFSRGGIRLSYHSPVTALIFGRFRVWSFCLLKNHMRLVTWRTAYCAHATIFKRGFGRYTDKSTPFKDVVHSTPPLFVLSCHSPSCNSLLRCTFQSPRTTGMESFCNNTNSSDSSGSFSMRSLTSCKSNEVWKSFETKNKKTAPKASNAK